MTKNEEIKARAENAAKKIGKKYATIIRFKYPELKFRDIYNVVHLGTNRMDILSKIEEIANSKTNESV